MRPVYRFIRKQLRLQGVELSRYWLPKVLATLAPDVVLDVGANVGQYAMELRAAGYRKRIVSFEPLAAAHAQLVRRSSRDPQWQIAPRMAIGDREGEAHINVAANSFSSSLLAMHDLHRQAAPQATYVNSETVPIQRLDSIAPQFMQAGERCLIKMDVQGYEQQVLDGAPACLAAASALQFETSLVPLYEGEGTLRTMLDRAAVAGFELWSVSPGFTDPRSGRQLQVDCLFVRPRALQDSPM